MKGLLPAAIVARASVVWTVAVLLAAPLVCDADARQAGDAAQQLPAPADRTPLRFQHLGIEDGMSQSSGDEILQDRHGFVWIGTQGGGLNRFDGRSFKVFRPIPGDTTSISDNFPRSLMEDSAGRLWVGTNDGLNLFNPVNETFTRFTLRPSPAEANIVYGIDEDRVGNLWLLTQRGIIRRDASTGAFSVEHDDVAMMGFDLLPPGGGNAILDEDGFFWAAAGTGLWRFDPASGEIREFIASIDTGSIAERLLGDIIVDSTDPDVLWVVGSGLYRVNRQDGSSTHYIREGFDDRDNMFISIAQQPHDPNRLWLAGFDAGLMAFDIRKESFSAFPHDPTNPAGPAANRLQDVYFDRSGLLWIGTGLNGVDRVDLAGGEFGHVRSIPGVPESLPSSEVRGITETTDGTVWIANPPHGFVSYDQATGGISRYEGVADVLPGPVWPIEPSADGTIWIGMFGGSTGDAVLRNFDPRTGALTDVAETSGAANAGVGALLEDADGVVWIGRVVDLDRFDPTTRSLDTGVLDRDVYVSYLYKDTRGRLWVCTRNGGVAVYDPASGNATWYEPNPASPNTIPAPWTTSVLQRRGVPDVYWISTYGGGLSRFDERTGEFRSYTVVDGLPDNVVYGILEDDDGLLWMSTNRGLTRFDPETETFQHFGTERGIQSWEFNQLAFHRSPSTGLMYFGGINGFNVFDPNKLTASDSPPQIAFTKFLIHNRVVEPGEDAPLRTNINLADQITLAPDQNGFGFEFAAMDFKIPSQNRYRYQLDGFDDDWVDGGHDGKAAYTNLRSGRYTFRVHGTNSNGRWSEAPASIRITILPPWWRTWWAYVGYVVVFALGVFAVDRVQRRRLLAKERQRAQARELEQAREIEKAYVELRDTKDRLVQQEKLASLGGLTAGIAHEIKNPLNFVNNFAELNDELVREALEDLRTGKVDDALVVLGDVQSNTAAISEHGRRADGIVRSMMAHASGQSGRRERVDLNALVSEYVDLAYHGKRAQAPDFEVTIEKRLSEDVGEVTMVASDIGRVILNLAGNAFDAVTERSTLVGDGFVPTVVVSTERRDHSAVIRVEDNGGGVPAAVQERIFEPFFTTKPTGRGTGLGLSLSHDIVTLGHGGSLTLESRSGEGATFVVELPVDRTQ